MKHGKLATIAIIGLIWVALCGQAQAGPIVGSIEFFGSATPSSSSLGPPVSIHFNDPWHTLAGTGDYAGIPFATLATFNDFTFTGDGSAANLPVPDLPLWTFSFNNITYSFDLLTLTNAHTEPGSMSLTGTGIVIATGFDETFATIGIQGAGSNFSFQISSSTTTSVPEANLNMLLGLGLMIMIVTVTLQKHRNA